MFEQYLESTETETQYAIVKKGLEQQLRGALRLVPGTRKHGKNCIEIPNRLYNKVNSMYYTYDEEPWVRVLWADTVQTTPRSAIKTTNLPIIPTEIKWVFKQKLMEDHIQRHTRKQNETS